MINIPYDVIIEKIKEKSGLSTQQIDEKINKKLEQLSGLISKEGAAHIIANELNIKLMQVEGLVKIKNFVAGMNNLEFGCKVIRKYDIKTFQNARGQGKVFRFLAGDDTGKINVVFWNDKADLSETFNDGDFLKVKGCNVRDNNGRLEIHMVDGGSLEVNPEGLKMDVPENNYSEAPRKKIKELNSSDSNAEIFCTVVQVFDPKFFKVNSETGKRVKDDDASETYGAVLNIFVDDGTDNIRVVLWKNQILNFLGINEQELMKIKDAPETFEPYKTGLLGSMIKLIGRVSKNEMFDRLEFIANLIFKDVNPDEEIKKIVPETSETKKETETTTRTLEEPKKEKMIDEDEDILSLDDIEDIEEDL